MSDLRGSIRQYDDLLHKRWDLATDEQKARIEQIKANTDRLRKDSFDCSLLIPRIISLYTVFRSLLWCFLKTTTEP